MKLNNYIGEIGLLLSQLGNELQKHAQSNQPLNIHGLVRQTMDNLTYYLHNLNSDLDAYRYNLIKDGESNLNLIEIESSSPTAEIYKMMFLIDSLYRLMAHGTQGSKEYIFDKITDKDR